MQATPRHSKLSLYFAKGTKFNTVSVANSVLPIVGEVFSAEPYILSMPLELLNDIPRILIVQPGTGNVVLGYTLAEMAWDWAGGLVIRDQLMSVATRMTNCLAVDHAVQIERVSVTLDCDLMQPISVRSFSERFLNSEAVRDLDDVQLAWKKRVSSSDIPLDKWIRLRSESETGAMSRVTLECSSVPRETALPSGEVSDIMKKVLQHTWSDAANGIII